MNENTPLPSDITSPNKIEALPNMGDDQQGIEERAQSFASLMQSKEQSPKAEEMTAHRVSNVSPFDLASNGAKPIGTPNLETLMAQTNLAHNTMTTVQTQLSNPDLKLKASQKYLVNNKLSDANANLRAANAKMGIAPKENREEINATSGKSGPIAQHLLRYVTDGLDQLEAAKKQLSSISAQGANLSPAEFMLVQLKMNKAQQELDFTSAVLGKSIEGFKSIMNVQI